MKRINDIVFNIEEDLTKIKKILEKEEIINLIKVLFSRDNKQNCIDQEKLENEINLVEIVRIDEEIWKINDM